MESMGSSGITVDYDKMADSSVQLTAGAVGEETDMQFILNLLIIIGILIIGEFVVKRYLVGKVEREEPVYGNE